MKEKVIFLEEFNTPRRGKQERKGENAPVTCACRSQKSNTKITGHVRRAPCAHRTRNDVREERREKRRRRRYGCGLLRARAASKSDALPSSVLPGKGGRRIQRIQTRGGSSYAGSEWRQLQQATNARCDDSPVASWQGGDADLSRATRIGALRGAAFEDPVHRVRRVPGVPARGGSGVDVRAVRL